MKLRAMGVAMQQVELLSLEQIEEFLEGAQGRAERYALFEALLERHRYSRLGRARKGLLRRFLRKVSGLSRAQTTRLIGQYRRERRVRPQSYRRRRFPTLYTRADIVLLARVDEAHRQLSGPATCAILRREYAVHGRREFVRLVRPLAKLHIEFIKSRARRSNDNALVETKNGAVLRKWLGYQFLPSAATAQIHAFYRDWLNPYLNFPRPAPSPPGSPTAAANRARFTAAGKPLTKPCSPCPGPSTARSPPAPSHA